MKNEYEALLQAAQTLQIARESLTKDEGSWVSPAWKMVKHAQDHVLKLADNVFRSEEVRS
jgi:hypothetical protein